MNLGQRRTIYRILAAATATLGVLVSLWYVSENQAFDVTTLLAGVVFPLVFGSAVLLVTKQRIALFVFLAYFWSIVDDGPVFFDSVLTWPEVTRFHPATPHIFLEVLLHALTLLFMALAVREALGGTRPPLPKALGVVVLALIAFRPELRPERPGGRDTDHRGTRMVLARPHRARCVPCLPRPRSLGLQQTARRARFDGGYLTAETGESPGRLPDPDALAVTRPSPRLRLSAKNRY